MQTYLKTNVGRYGYGTASDDSFTGVYLDGEIFDIPSSSAVQITENEYVNVLNPDDYIKIDLNYYNEGSSENVFKLAKIVDKVWSETSNTYVFTTLHANGKTFVGPIIGASVQKLSEEQYKTLNKKSKRTDAELLQDTLNKPLDEDQRKRPKTDRLDPTDDAASFDRQKTARNARIAAERKKASSSDFNVVHFKLKGTESMPFDEKLVKFVETDNREWLEMLFADEMNRYLNSVDRNNIDVFTNLIEQISSFRQDVFLKQVFTKALFKAVEGGYSSSMSMLFEFMDKMLKCRVIPHFFRASLFLLSRDTLFSFATRSKNIKCLEILLSTYSDDVFISKSALFDAFVIAYRDRDPSYAIIQLYVNHFLTREFATTPPNTPAYLEAMYKEFAQHSTLLPSLQFVFLAVTSSPRATKDDNDVARDNICQGILKKILHSDTPNEQVLTYLIHMVPHFLYTIITTENLLYTIITKQLYESANILLAYGASQPTYNASLHVEETLFRLVDEKNEDGVLYLLKYADAVTLDFKKTINGRTIHQLALDKKDEANMSHILDALFVDKICAKNTEDPENANCLTDNIHYECLNPNDDVLINYNHFSGQGQECFGPYLRQLQDESRLDPFSRTEIRSVRVNDIVERLFDSAYADNIIRKR